MLTVPLVAAAATAGLIGGIHCAGMCGGIGAMLGSNGAPVRKIIPITAAGGGAATKNLAYQIALHGGRLSSYALMGAVVGMLGGAGMLFKPSQAMHAALVVFGNLALIWLGLRIAGYAPTSPGLGRIGERMVAVLRVPRRHPFWTGMAWGCLPCGLLYGVLPFALLSGDAGSGAILMLAFGFGALPYLLFAQWAGSLRAASHTLKGIGAAVLIGFGIFGLWHINSADMPDIFCVAAL